MLLQGFQGPDGIWRSDLGEIHLAMVVCPVAGCRETFVEITGHPIPLPNAEANIIGKENAVTGSLIGHLSSAHAGARFNCPICGSENVSILHVGWHQGGDHRWRKEP